MSLPETGSPADWLRYIRTDSEDEKVDIMGMRRLLSKMSQNPFQRFLSRLLGVKHSDSSNTPDGGADSARARSLRM